jgi:hypothetical protein
MIYPKFVEYEWQASCCGKTCTEDEDLNCCKKQVPSKRLITCRYCDQPSAHYRVGSELWEGWVKTTRSYLHRIDH